MNAPQLLLRPDLGKRAYRLRCQFHIGQRPRRDFLERAKYAAAEKFIADMHRQGWEYVERYGFRMIGPFPTLRPIAIPKRVRVPSAREMLEGVKQGNPYRAAPSYGVQNVPLVAESEEWTYELAGVFVHKTILMDYPDQHEEIRA